MTSAIALPAIKRSPATLQYRIPHDRPAKFYEPRFSLKREDRDKTLNADWFKKVDPMMPHYPYGADVRYPEANEGLYGGSSIASGNKISKGRNKGKTLRKWYPNIKVERIKSDALGRELTIPIAARVMRTIRKVGGLDQYLTGEKPARIKELGLLGWKLRWMVVNSDGFKEQYVKERAQMNQSGLESATNPLDETFEQAWADAEKRDELVDKQCEKWDALREKDEKFQKHFLNHLRPDGSRLKASALSTLAMYNPSSVNLHFVQVTENGRAKFNDPANNVR